MKIDDAHQFLGTCRHFAIALIPLGNSSFSKAVDDALAQKGGDALINVTVSSVFSGIVVLIWILLKDWGSVSAH